MNEYPFMYVQQLANRLDEQVGMEVRSQVLAGAETLTSKTNKKQRALIMKGVMERMEELIEPDIAVRIRASCACKPPGFMKEAKAIHAQWPDLPTFLEKVAEKRFLGSPLRLENNRIVGEFGFRACVCSKVNGSKEPLPMLWCECCKGHIIWMYEGIFGRPLRVDLTESVITGGEECRYIVYL